jgi:hypothetical protein
LTDSILAIFINLSTESPKYLVLHNKNSTKQDNSTTTTTTTTEKDQNEQQSKRLKLDHDAFIKQLQIYKFETLNELKIKLYDCIESYSEEYGVLSFLYSLLLTKGLDRVGKELEDNGEPLISQLHGHGSQSLTNLLLFGLATSNVFDGDKCLEGLSEYY